MILTEQLCKNLYRSYFRGQKKDWNHEKSLFDEVYYMTSPIYALFYAAKENGIVSEYKLKSPVNIFNLKSKTDRFALHKYLNENHMNHMLWPLSKMENNDWGFMLESDTAREELLEIIKELGYDGYFNYEYDLEMKNFLKNITSRSLPVSDKNPAIGVFHNDVFIKIKDWTIDEIRDSDFVSDYKKQEIEKLENLFKSELNRECSYRKCVDRLDDFYVLSKNEFFEYLDVLYADWTPEKAKKSYKKKLEWVLTSKRLGLSQDERKKLFEKILNF